MEYSRKVTALGRRMVTILTPGRAYKRLLYFVLVWTCICFVTFSLTFSSGRSWDEYFSSSTTRVLQQQPFNNNNLDLPANGINALPLPVELSIVTSSSVIPPSPSENKNAAIAAADVSVNVIVDSAAPQTSSEQEVIESLINPSHQIHQPPSSSRATSVESVSSSSISSINSNNNGHSTSSPTPITAAQAAIRKITFDAQDLETTKDFVINKLNFCDDDNGATNDLLVVVNSAVSHFEARDAIRKTWGQFAVERGSLFLFLIGSPDPSQPDADIVQEKVLQEESLHGDLLQGIFVDNYYNLTLKTISLLRWVNSTCDRIKYVLKIDDDMFVNMQMMVDFCETRSFPRSVIGKLARRWKPHRNPLSKWYVPSSAFNGSVYPNFATGPAYMFTGDAVRPLLETALNSTNIYLEDVNLGIIAEKAGVRRLNHGLVKNVRLRVDACTFKRFMTSHRHSPQEILSLWKLVYDPVAGKNCSQSTTTTTKSRPVAHPPLSSAAVPASPVVVASQSQSQSHPTLQLVQMQNLLPLSLTQMKIPPPHPPPPPPVEEQFQHLQQNVIPGS